MNYIYYYLMFKQTDIREKWSTNYSQKNIKFQILLWFYSHEYLGSQIVFIIKES